MSGDKDDKADRILRGNTEHDPKPDFSARRSAAPRGLGAPSLAPGWGGVSRTSTQPERPMRADRQDEPKASPNMPGQPRKFRRLGEPKQADQASPDRSAEPEKPRKFRGFGRGDLSRGFNDRSR